MALYVRYVSCILVMAGYMGIGDYVGDDVQGRFDGRVELRESEEASQHIGG